MTALGAAALQIARRELGKGESGGNNRGPDVVRYRRGVDDGQPWCAALMIYCLEEGAQTIGRVCPVKRSRNAKRLARNVIAAGGTLIDRPEAGCLVLWHRGAAGALTGHIGIVSRVGDGSDFWTIEGNRGGFPSLNREYQHEVGEPNLLGFYRLPA